MPSFYKYIIFFDVEAMILYVNGLRQQLVVVEPCYQKNYCVILHSLFFIFLIQKPKHLILSLYISYMILQNKKGINWLVLNYRIFRLCDVGVSFTICLFFIILLPCFCLYLNHLHPYVNAHVCLENSLTPQYCSSIFAQSFWSNC